MKTVYLIILTTFIMLFSQNIKNPKIYLQQINNFKKTTAGIDSNITIVSSLNTAGYAYNPDIKDSLLFLADGSDGLKIFNIKNRQNPFLVGNAITSADAFAVIVNDTLAYVANDLSGITIINVKNPSLPFILSTFDTPGEAVGIVKKGDFVFVADGSGGLRVIDVSVPASPQEVGSLSTSQFFYDVYIVGNVLFAADWVNGLKIIDITDPANPFFLGQYNTPGFAIGVAADTDHAYIADESQGVKIVNVSTPSSPYLVSSVSTGAVALDVQVSGHYLYVADNGDGVYVIDVFDAQNPRIIGRYDTEGNARGIDVFQDIIFVADGDKGIILLKDELSFIKNMEAAWNLLGLPLDVPDKYYLTIFPQSQTPLYRWNGTVYQAVAFFTLGEGYFLNYFIDDQILLQGNRLDSRTINLREGWSIISGISCPVPVTAISDPQQIIVDNTIFAYENGYSYADSIYPGEAYWVLTDAAGAITLDCGQVLPKISHRTNYLAKIANFPYLKVNNKNNKSINLYLNVSNIDQQMIKHYSLPPKPPAGFDARFQRDYLISETSQDIITIQADNDVSVQVYNLAENQYLYLENMLSKNKYLLYEKEISALQKEDGPEYIVKLLSLNEYSTEIPSSFKVFQNYPNPFNPETTIEFSLAKEGFVSLAVFDLQGRKIRTLINDYKTAGSFTRKWNGLNDHGEIVAAGVYFYKLTASDYTGIRKMLLVK